LYGSNNRALYWGSFLPARDRPATIRPPLPVRTAQLPRYPLRNGNLPMNVTPADHSPAACWPTLLCIDDDPQILEAIRLRLREYEVEMLSADHGTHGVWLASTERPDLIISDIRMPQGQGDYLVECLRNHPDTRETPIIVLTGQRSPDVIQKVRSLGVQALLTKPVPFEQLLAVIKQHVPLRPRVSEPPELATTDLTDAHG
jgi:response regulator RpfG family c-di-GMP phosphodiesterase